MRHSYIVEKFFNKYPIFKLRHYKYILYPEETIEDVLLHVFAGELANYIVFEFNNKNLDIVNNIFQDIENLLKKDDEVITDFILYGTLERLLDFHKLKIYELMLPLTLKRYNDIRDFWYG